ncbi:MAG TPA: hypothetical protein DFR83_20230 [Deltaproteobacteria bacterium]|nr:hypothetical protein [Deltaproteobacteria bacterium]
MWKIEMDQASAGAVVAVLVGAAACMAGGGGGDKDTGADTGYALPYVPRDSGWGGGDDGDTTGDISSGTYSLYIERTCGIIWDMAGTAVGGLAWEVDLYVNAATDCSNVEDVLGRSFALQNGWAYFENDYIGSATYGGGTARWATSGYITGGGGGSYYYAGRIDY